MTNVNETVVSYIAAWNEQDPKRRRDLVVRHGPRTAATSTPIVAAPVTARSTPCSLRHRRNSQVTAST
jgi:hypothetical protein